MSSVIASPAASGAAFDPPREAIAAPAAAERRYGLQFSGSGSEYFRVWIVNLLLTLATLGFYYPFAKVRKLRYFYGNTSVAGHAFDFHADGWRMLRGYLLVGLLFVLYSAASNVSPVAGLVGFIAVAALWPALLRASLRFRLANTSWRGLRFRFAGNTAGAYKAMLPLFAPGAAFFVAAALLPQSQDDNAAEAFSAGAAAAGLGMMLAGLASLALVPLFWWALKRYQHDHYQLAAVRTRLAAGPGAFYALFAKGSGIVLMLMLGIGAVFGVLAGVFGAAGSRGPGATASLVIVLIIAAYAGTIVLLYPYFTSRLQNLVWSRTESRSLRFDSQLRFAPLLGLTLKNWLLVVLTLGLYWPFAAVATARMRVQAVSVIADIDLDTLATRSREGVDDASGDAAGDLFGIDVGL